MDYARQALLEAERENVEPSYRMVMLRMRDHEAAGRLKEANECAAIRHEIERITEISREPVICDDVPGLKWTAYQNADGTPLSDMTDTNDPREMTPDEVSEVRRVGRLEAVKLHRSWTRSTLRSAIRCVDAAREVRPAAVDLRGVIRQIQELATDTPTQEDMEKALDDIVRLCEDALTNERP